MAVYEQYQSGAYWNRERRFFTTERDHKGRQAYNQIKRMAAAPIYNGAQNVGYSPKSKLNVKSGRDPSGRIGETGHEHEKNGRSKGAVRPEEGNCEIEQARGGGGQ